jgi:hydrophobic/amphiphilic exporter-1 (mainly G- bacteria), HAE1 family
MSSATVFEGDNTAEITIFVPAKRKWRSEQILRKTQQILATLPEAEAVVVPQQSALQTSLGSDSAPLMIEVSGEDLGQLQLLTSAVTGQLQELPELQQIQTPFTAGQPQIQLVLDRDRLSLLKVDLDELRSELEQQLQGVDAGTWEQSGEQQQISIKLPRVHKQDLANLMVGRVRLDEIADIKSIAAPREITRRNQVRSSQITALLAGSVPFDRAMASVREKISRIQLPPNYSIQITGEEFKRAESFAGLRFALLLSILLVYMVMAAEFESLLHPFTILLTIPLAGIGAVLTFYIFGKSFNMMAYIGIIMLGGIAVNNSILLVDAIMQFRRQGMELREAILLAGQNRIRPILITSLTTIFGMLPLSLGFGEGAALRSPLALAVMGGLITSTLMSLVVIPCVYQAFETIKMKVTR